MIVAAATVATMVSTAMKWCREGILGFLFSLNMKVQLGIMGCRKKIPFQLS